MKEMTFELGEFIPYANVEERTRGNPDAQPRQAFEGVFEAEEDTSRLNTVRDELFSNPFLLIILPVEGDSQPPMFPKGETSEQENPKRPVTIEDAIVLILLALFAVFIGIFKAIDNKAKAYFENQKGMFDGPGRRFLEGYQPDRSVFNTLQPEILTGHVASYRVPKGGFVSSNPKPRG